MKQWTRNFGPYQNKIRAHPRRDHSLDQLHMYRISNHRYHTTHYPGLFLSSPGNHDREDNPLSSLMLSCIPFLYRSRLQNSHQRVCNILCPPCKEAVLSHLVMHHHLTYLSGGKKFHFQLLYLQILQH